MNFESIIKLSQKELKKALHDELKQLGYTILGFTDNNCDLHGTEYLGLPILPPSEVFYSIKTEQRDTELVIATSDLEFLADIYKQVILELPDESISIFHRGLNDYEIDRTKLMTFLK